jgi:hypothetical protein
MVFQVINNQFSGDKLKTLIVPFGADQPACVAALMRGSSTFCDRYIQD